MNKKNFKKCQVGFLSLVLALTSINVNAFSMELLKLDPSCNHINVSKTFNELSPCEFGDVEDYEYIYCKDCGGLIEKKIKVKESMHGQETFVEDGVKKCKFCGRAINEKIDLKEGIMRIEEVPKYQEILKKVKTELYANYDYKRSMYDDWLKMSEKGLDKTDSEYYSKVIIIKGKNDKLKPLDISKLDEDLNCKNDHNHMILIIKQNKNLDDKEAKVTLNYKCLDCNYDSYITYKKDEIDTVSKRRTLAKTDKNLETFWNEIGLLKDGSDIATNVDELNFFEKIMVFFDKLFNRE